MGGFLYAARDEGEDIGAVALRLESSLKTMERRGLTHKATLEGPLFALFVFDRAQRPSENLFRHENGDFVVATGTLFYRRRTGAEALRRLYEDFTFEGNALGDLKGHFSVWIAKGKALYVFNDAGGLYHVYRDADGRVLANSFLAVAKSLRRRTASEQELYEYVSHGAMYGESTFLREIKRLDSDCVYQLHPEPRMGAKKADIPSLDPSRPQAEMIDQVVEALTEYFTMLAENIQGNICTALSGGYDSRLMLGLLRKVGLEPYLYVYGTDGSSDVRVSRMIAEEEGIPLHHRDKSRWPQPKPDEFLELLEAQFHFYDGQGVAGVFDNGSDLGTRRERTAAAELQLNGGGGEIYRNAFKLPDRSITVRSFVQARFARVVWEDYTERFDRRAYLRGCAEKVKRALGIESNRIRRREVQLIYPRLRLRYWMGQNNSNSNVLSRAVTPFSEPVFTWPSADVPLSYKECGRFEAALIRRVAPDLAAYSSAYGFNFQDPVPVSYRVKTALNVHLPAFLKPVVARRILRRAYPAEMPFYLTPAYLEAVLDPRAPAVSEYVHVDRIRDPSKLSRALTVELVLSDRF